MPPKTVSRPHPATVYARTGKGVLSFKKGTAQVSSEIRNLFSCIDGKASVAELGVRCEMDAAAVEEAFETLEESGYVNVFKQGVEQAAPDFTEAPVRADAPDLDFTAMGSLLEVSVRDAAKVKAEADTAPAPPASAAEEKPRLHAETTPQRETLEVPIGDSLALAQERIAHVELQLATERETREKMVQALRESQSQAEAGRNAAEMRVKEMEIAVQQADKLENQNRERLRQIEAQIETARRARADAEAALAAAGREHAERTSRIELERDTERSARADAEAKAVEERGSREKLERALREIGKVIGSVEAASGPSSS